ncbi:alpha/beta fold hydrolase [Erythrobacter crassostreae]|uniref:Alpha/beta hydrolase n=1 Tax=Erythrobacter crassostreae TaxID=2828328 RepID=A0A9X1F295_9SPHN|nr:alpha/beta hydrolase [Erythrobacter crassostrea]MBV7258666.1 alpha/beta hydrolase [Erythrobacter crassostrea]
MRRLGLILAGSLIATSACAPTLPINAELPVQAENPVSADPAAEYANALAGPGAPYREGYVGEGDNRIHYVEAGEGPTVLFVHGFPSFWYVWRDQMEALRHCRRVIAIDALGAGLSAKPKAEEAYRVEILARRLHTLIGELAPGEKIMLVGHDWGGALAWSYVQSDASRVERLAVFSAPSYNLLLDLLANDPEQRAASSYMPKLLEIDRQTASTTAFAQSFFDLAYQRMLDTDVLDAREGELFKDALHREGALYAGIQWYKANIPAFDNLDPASAYWPKAGTRTDVPVLLVRGAQDRTFVQRMEFDALDEATDLTTLTIDGVGHWTPFQEPFASNEALAEFILGQGRTCR